MKHTPGPWFCRVGDEWSHSVVTRHGTLPDGSDNCWTVASINKQREPEHEANARLIAAAPELLDALRMIFLDLGLRSRMSAFQVQTARNAIDKATGKPE